jgi:putative aminopeptidase FrvX
MEAIVNISKSSRFVVVMLFCSLGMPAQTPQKLKEGFIQCAEIQAVTGREGRLINYLKNLLPTGAKSEIDNMGNLTAQFGDGVPQLLIVTSVDEPGYLVTDITEDGFLRVSSPGGRTPNPLFVQFHEGHYVDITARGEVIKGLVALPSSHLVRGRRENLTLERFLIDIGARSRAEALARGIEMLQPVTAVKDMASLAGNRVAGPMLSRKFGAFALVEVAKGYSAKPGKGIVFAWVTQSAMSNPGIARLAKRFTPQQVLVVGALQRGTGRTAKDPADTLDSGVLVPDPDSPGGASPLLRSLLQAAEQKIKITRLPAGAPSESRAFGANADAFSMGIPVLFPGSLVETIDMDDLSQLIACLRVLLEGRQ